MRIAQRIGLHSESTLAKLPTFEAEMRRRLWWSLLLFDTRMCELAEYKTAMLVPTWDCKTPLNVNDFDLQPEMKDLPVVQGSSTESLFVVLRCEMGDFIRNSAYHLDFTVPALKAVARDVQHRPVPAGGELVALEKLMEEKYLKYCNPEIPLHFMTIWTSRAHLARNRLIEMFSKFAASPAEQTDAQRDAAVGYALEMLECDTKVMISHLTKGYAWFTELYMPMVAYIHLVHELRTRPVSDHAEQCWRSMSASYEAHFLSERRKEEVLFSLERYNNPFWKMFSKFVLHAWNAREVALSQSQKPVVLPRMVLDLRDKRARLAQGLGSAKAEGSSDVLESGFDDFDMGGSMDLGGHGMHFGMETQSHDGFGTGSSEPGHAALDHYMNSVDWNAMAWGSTQVRDGHHASLAGGHHEKDHHQLFPSATLAAQQHLQQPTEWGNVREKHDEPQNMPVYHYQ